MGVPFSVRGRPVYRRHRDIIPIGFCVKALPFIHCAPPENFFGFEITDYYILIIRKSQYFFI